MGRPTDYTKELGDLICKRLADGDSLLRICKEEGFPHRSNVHKWLLDDSKKEFRDKYEFAVNVRAEKMFDELTDIADDGTNDYQKKLTDNGEVVVANKEHIQRSRLRVDTRKWYLSKIMPKKFGEKIDMTTDGKELPSPIAYVQRDNSLQEDTQSE